MTKMYYVLNDGTKVMTMAEALASGQKYSVHYEPINEVSAINDTRLAKAKRVKL